jgi:hypothetical protein
MFWTSWVISHSRLVLRAWARRKLSWAEASASLSLAGERSEEPNWETGAGTTGVANDTDGDAVEAVESGEENVVYARVRGAGAGEVAGAVVVTFCWSLKAPEGPAEPALSLSRVGLGGSIDSSWSLGEEMVVEGTISEGGDVHW